MLVLLLLLSIVSVNSAVVDQELHSTRCGLQNDIWYTCRDNNLCNGDGLCTDTILPPGGVCEKDSDCSAQCQLNEDGIYTCNGERTIFTRIFRYAKTNERCGFYDNRHVECLPGAICNILGYCEPQENYVGVGAKCGTIIEHVLENKCLPNLECVDERCLLSYSVPLGGYCSNNNFALCQLGLSCIDNICSPPTQQLWFNLFISLAVLAPLLTLCYYCSSLNDEDDE